LSSDRNNELTAEGIKTLKISFIGLVLTALFQCILVFLTNSAALLADTIHNFSDAFTSIPLWIAFALSMRKSTRTMTYGYGKIEDLAGILVILFIIASGIVVVYESVMKIIYPIKVTHTDLIIVAGIIGFIGNEFVAKYRIKTGKKIGSAALAADGKHSMIDGITSLGVVASAISVKLGFSTLDPIIGILISILIFGIVIQSSKTVIQRVLDIIDPEMVNSIEYTVKNLEGIKSVHDIKARWIGHELHFEIAIAVDNNLSVQEGHQIAIYVQNKLMKIFPHLKSISIHVDPVSLIGEERHIENIYHA
jgi:cation diffusion facilitator family transporter